MVKNIVIFSGLGTFFPTPTPTTVRAYWTKKWSRHLIISPCCPAPHRAS